jgi:uncharacterized RDD family membrane protein YckC
MVWYYVKDGARQGPVDESEFGRLVGQAVVRPDTLVWSEGMAEWKPYSAIAPGGSALYSQPAPVAPAPTPIAPAPVEPRVETFTEPAPVSPVAPSPVAPESAAYAAPIAAPVPTAQMMYCSQCGGQYPVEELVRFGTATVCGNCKDIYAQRLRETGQVAGGRVYGGFWIRFVAVLIDGIALWIVNFAIQSVTRTRITNPGDLTNIALVMSSIGINFIISISISLFYESFFMVQYGATPGKMIFKLRVITPDGGGLTWGRAIGRYFAKMLSGIILMIGYIMAGFDSEKRALHDYIAGTRVIRTA